MVKKENIKTIFRGIIFVFGVFLLALTYNVFLHPNNLVVGGMSGLAIVLERLININATFFIYASSLILLVLSFLFLGSEKTSNTVVGSFLYPLFVTFTSPISDYIIERLDIPDTIFMVCIAGILYGIANGLIYKMGFTTGGGDIVMQLLSKFFKMPEATANFIYSAIIVSMGLMVFGLTDFIYAVVILVISNILIKNILLESTDSKVFFISSIENKKIQKLLTDDYDSGYTILDGKSNYLNKKREVIMVVVPNRYYYSLKQEILTIDPNAFFIINDCYEVNGGMRDENIPFL